MAPTGGKPLQSNPKDGEKAQGNANPEHEKETSKIGKKFDPKHKKEGL